MDSPSKKSSCGCRNSYDYTNLLPILKPIGNWRIECMLSAMHFGGRKRVLYYWSHLVWDTIQEWMQSLTKQSTIFLQHLWRNIRHSGTFPQIPEKCHSYFWRATFRVGIFGSTRVGEYSDQPGVRPFIRRHSLVHWIYAICIDIQSDEPLQCMVQAKKVLLLSIFH